MVLLDLQKILGALGMVSSLIKPIPIVGPIAGGVVDTVGGIAGGVVGTLPGAVNGLLGGDTGILAAQSINTTFALASSDGDDGDDDDDDDNDNDWNDSAANNTSTPSYGTGNSTTTNSTTPAYTTNTTTSSIGTMSTDNSCAVEPYYPPTTLLLEPFAEYNAEKALVYRYRQQQSVNLGSWFVQEQWMNPTLFKCAAGNKQAELDIASGWGSIDNARQVLERHWDEWITEKDFEYLASIGINTVRLPIGYWSLGPVYCQGTAFETVSAAYANSWPRVVRAINWAEKYGLGVLVDLHGAPGSQNGQGHAGTSDGQQNLFNNPTNIQLTINILTYLTQQLVKVNNVVGIEILNEPSNVDSLPAFYSQVLGVLRQVSPEAAAFPFYIHDGFDMSRFADYISTRSDFVVLDHHSYFVFGDSSSQKIPASQLATDMAPGQGSISQQIIAAASEERRNIVIDEFSCALSGDALANSTDPIGDRRKFCTGQMESYTNATAGWSFWSYKTESCPGDTNWCFTSAVGNSLPSTFFSYPNATIASLAAQSASSSSSSDSSSLADDPSFLSFGTAMPSDSEYSPPNTDEWLSALGAQDSEYDRITEALATTEYDLDPASDSGMSSINVKSAKTTGNPIKSASKPIGQAVDAQAAFANININTATIPSSRLNQNSKRSLLTDLPQRALLFASEIQQHRFLARHRRSQHRRSRVTSAAAARRVRRDDTATATPGQNAAIGYTPEQAAISKGYADGWRAAKTFAAFGSSRLGFTGQFVNDALLAMGNKVLKGDEPHYKTWFMKGLADGEMQVIKLMAMEAQGPQ